MSSIHIREIMRLSGTAWNSESTSAGDGFIEIQFDEARSSDAVVDELMVNRVITVQSPQGNVVIEFDDLGMLKTLEIT